MDPLLAQMHDYAEKAAEEMYQNALAHMKWFGEVLENTKKLADRSTISNESMVLLPKTPKKKTRRGRTRKASESEAETEVEIKPPKKRLTVKDCSVRLEALTDLPVADGSLQKLTSEEVTEEIHIKPIKPPRKTAKENQSPFKTPSRGYVATQVDVIEEKIKLYTGTPSQMLSSSKILKESNSSQRKAVTLASLDVPKESVVAKVTELEINRMSILRKRSSRMRCKLKSAKAALRKSARIDERKSLASFSASQSPSFFTAENSPETTEMKLESSEAVNETVNDTSGSFGATFIKTPPATEPPIVSTSKKSIDIQGPSNVAKISTNENIEIGKKASVIENSSSPKKVMVKKHSYRITQTSRTSPMAYSSIQDFGKKLMYRTSNTVSRFGMKRSASPAGSLYKCAFTPDKFSHIQSAERMAVIEARAESVIKNRDNLIKQRVEAQKKKREAKMVKVKKAKEIKEQERIKKIKTLEEMEKKKMLLKMKALQEQKERERLELEKQKQAAMKLVKKTEQITATKSETESFVKPSTSKPNLDATYCTDSNGKEVLNTTVSTYEMTPKNRPLVLKNPQNYDIGDLREEDSTDDEEQPKKPIPSWAKGEDYKLSMLNQMDKNLYKVFSSDLLLKNPNLNEIFNTKKKYHRTSSAVWTKPILKN